MVLFFNDLMKRLLIFFTLSLPFLTQAQLPVADIKRDKPVNFATEVYPFLKENCLACHNSTKAKADLILESPQDMIRGGDTGPSIEPGNADASFLFTTAAHIEEPTMPPANNKSKAENLTPEQLALLKLWINEGAKGGRCLDPCTRIVVAPDRTPTHLHCRDIPRRAVRHCRARTENRCLRSPAGEPDREPARSRLRASDRPSRPRPDCHLQSRWDDRLGRISHCKDLAAKCGVSRGSPPPT